MIKIQPTRNTPGVLLDPKKGVFKIFGRSSPENSLEFYDPIRTALSRTTQTPKIDVRIKMDYFNTSSSKCIYDLLREVKILKEGGKAVSVRWYYEAEDEDILEAGEDYSDLLNLPFKFLPYYPQAS